MRRSLFHRASRLRDARGNALIEAAIMTPLAVVVIASITGFDADE
jgi:Flp pilus assembly protein TadG